MEILNDIFMRVGLLRIGYNSLDCKSLNSVDILNIIDEVRILYFFRVGASCIFSAEKVR